MSAYPMPEKNSIENRGCSRTKAGLLTYRVEISAVAIALGIDVVATDFVSLVRT